ncbi:MAG: lytic transglycosylase domain-containing protein, partial [Paracraurococcus sp.]
MRRRSLIALPALLGAPLLPLGLRGDAAAQSTADPASARAAGRQALALAGAQRWAEAEAAAQAAEPPIRQYVTWLRLQQRGQAAGAAEVVNFVLAHPDWPGQDMLGRRAEELLAADPDDELAAQWFAARAPRSLDAYQRLADALARAGRPEEARQVLRTGWAEAPADALAEQAFLARNATLLTAADHARRFDRLALARDLAGASRVLPALDPA